MSSTRTHEPSVPPLFTPTVSPSPLLAACGLGPTPPGEQSVTPNASRLEMGGSVTSPLGGARHALPPSPIVAGCESAGSQVGLTMPAVRHSDRPPVVPATRPPLQPPTPVAAAAASHQPSHMERWSIATNAMRVLEEASQAAARQTRAIAVAAAAHLRSIDSTGLPSEVSSMCDDFNATQTEVMRYSLRSSFASTSVLHGTGIADEAAVNAAVQALASTFDCVLLFEPIFDKFLTLVSARVSALATPALVSAMSETFVMMWQPATPAAVSTVAVQHLGRLLSTAAAMCRQSDALPRQPARTASPSTTAAAEASSSSCAAPMASMAFASTFTIPAFGPVFGLLVAAAAARPADWFVRDRSAAATIARIVSFLSLVDEEALSDAAARDYATLLYTMRPQYGALARSTQGAPILIALMGDVVRGANARRFVFSHMEELAVDPVAAAVVCALFEHSGSQLPPSVSRRLMGHSVSAVSPSLSQPQGRSSDANSFTSNSATAEPPLVLLAADSVGADVVYSALSRTRGLYTLLMADVLRRHQPRLVASGPHTAQILQWAQAQRSLDDAIVVYDATAHDEEYVVPLPAVKPADATRKWQNAVGALRAFERQQQSSSASGNLPPTTQQWVDRALELLDVPPLCHCSRSTTVAAASIPSPATGNSSVSFAADVEVEYGAGGAAALGSKDQGCACSSQDCAQCQMVHLDPSMDHNTSVRIARRTHRPRAANGGDPSSPVLRAATSAAFLHLPLQIVVPRTNASVADTSACDSSSRVLATVAVGEIEPTAGLAFYLDREWCVGVPLCADNLCAAYAQGACSCPQQCRYVHVSTDVFNKVSAQQVRATGGGSEGGYTNAFFYRSPMEATDAGPDVPLASGRMGAGAAPWPHAYGSRARAQSLETVDTSVTQLGAPSAASSDGRSPPRQHSLRLMRGGGGGGPGSAGARLAAAAGSPVAGPTSQQHGQKPPSSASSLANALRIRVPSPPLVEVAPDEVIMNNNSLTSPTARAFSSIVNAVVNTPPMPPFAPGVNHPHHHQHQQHIGPEMARTASGAGGWMNDPYAGSIRSGGSNRSSRAAGGATTTAVLGCGITPIAGRQSSSSSPTGGALSHQHHSQQHAYSMQQQQPQVQQQPRAVESWVMGTVPPYEPTGAAGDTRHLNLSSSDLGSSASPQRALGNSWPRAPWGGSTGNAASADVTGAARNSPSMRPYQPVQQQQQQQSAPPPHATGQQGSMLYPSSIPTVTPSQQQPSQQLPQPQREGSASFNDHLDSYRSGVPMPQQQLGGHGPAGSPLSLDMGGYGHRPTHMYQQPQRQPQLALHSQQQPHAHQNQSQSFLPTSGPFFHADSHPAMHHLHQPVVMQQQQQVQQPLYHLQQQQQHQQQQQPLQVPRPLGRSPLHGMPSGFAQHMQQLQQQQQSPPQQQRFHPYPAAATPTAPMTFVAAGSPPMVLSGVGAVANGSPIQLHSQQQQPQVLPSYQTSTGGTPVTMNCTGEFTISTPGGAAAAAAAAGAVQFQPLYPQQLQGSPFTHHHLLQYGHVASAMGSPAGNMAPSVSTRSRGESTVSAASTAALLDVTGLAGRWVGPPVPAAPLAPNGRRPPARSVVVGGAAGSLADAVAALHRPRGSTMPHVTQQGSFSLDALMAAVAERELAASSQSPPPPPPPQMSMASISQPRTNPASQQQQQQQQFQPPQEQQQQGHHPKQQQRQRGQQQQSASPPPPPPAYDAPPLPPPPPGPPPAPSTQQGVHGGGTSRWECKYWKLGCCDRGDACTFRHVGPPRNRGTS